MDLADKVKGQVKKRSGNIIYIQKGMVGVDQNAPDVEEALKEVLGKD